MWQKFAWVGAGVTLGAVLSVAVSVRADKDLKETIPVDELRAFSEVFARIKASYVEPVDDKVLINKAIAGMVNSLDPHSTYLDEEGLKDMKTVTTGKFGGLGIEIGIEDDFIKVVSPIDDTPAARAGIRAGDLIVKVDGESTRGLSTTKAVDKMRGTPGTKVKLEIFRKEDRSTQNLTIIREQIKVQAVKAKLIEPGISFIRVRAFNDSTVGDVVKALQEHSEKGPLKGVILDVRNNPGGLLGAAVGLSAIFLPPDALVVYTEGRIPDAKARYTANKNFYSNSLVDPLVNLPANIKTVPVVVLTNGGAASASEIVAGALQDHKRATIMGSATFGKGSVQNIMALSPTTGLKLTTSRYFTPNGRSIQGAGIVPDVLIDQLTFDGVMSPKTVREKDLSQHLVGKNEVKEKDDEVEQDQSEEAVDKRIAKAREDNKKLKGFDWGNEKDFVYAQALNKLNGAPVLTKTADAPKLATISEKLAADKTPAKK